MQLVAKQRVVISVGKGVRAYLDVLLLFGLHSRRNTVDSGLTFAWRSCIFAIHGQGSLAVLHLDLCKRRNGNRMTFDEPHRGQQWGRRKRWSGRTVVATNQMRHMRHGSETHGCAQAWSRDSAELSCDQYEKRRNHWRRLRVVGIFRKEADCPLAGKPALSWRAWQGESCSAKWKSQRLAELLQLYCPSDISFLKHWDTLTKCPELTMSTLTSSAISEAQRYITFRLITSLT